MKFVTNTISTKSKVPTLAEMYKAAQTKAAMSKSASAVKPPVTKTASKVEAVEEIEIPIEVKTAKGNVSNFGDKKAPPFGKKDDKKGKKVEVEIEVEDKKASSPKAVKKAEKGESDEAESSGQLDVEPLHQKGESTGEKPCNLDTQKTDKAPSGGGKSKGEGDEAESSGQPEAEAKLVNEPKVDKDAGAKDRVKKIALKKIAELTAEEKDFLRGVWGNFWPKAFIDAILKPQ